MSSITVQHLTHASQRQGVPREIAKVAQNELTAITAWWRVRRDGVRLSAFVVRTRTGLTVIDRHGQMLTCWHAGPTPGDLARQVGEAGKLASVPEDLF